MAQRRNLLAKATGNAGAMKRASGPRGSASMGGGARGSYDPRTGGVSPPRAPSAPSVPGSGGKRGGGPAPTSPTDPHNPVVTKPTGPKPITANDIMAKGQAGVLATSSYNPASGQPDPRGPEYWKNYYLLKQQAQSSYGTSLYNQNVANVDYGRTVSDTTKNRTDNRGKFARSLIGTGLLRSGYHNMEQTTADDEYNTNLNRMASDKGVADSQAFSEQQGILSNFANQEYAAYETAVQSAAEAAAGNAAEGDPVYGGGTRSLKSYNKQITGLRSRYKKAGDAEQKKRILNKIKQARKAKNKQYGRKGGTVSGG